MIEAFLLIGWINGERSGGVVSQEFLSLESCQTAKQMYVEMHDIQPPEERYRWNSWVECVKK